MEVGITKEMANFVFVEVFDTKNKKLIDYEVISKKKNYEKFRS